MAVYAHSMPNLEPDGWEPLDVHLSAVGAAAARFASPFGCAALAGLAGRLHDIGKASAAFQAYIRGQRASGGDHSSAGAREALTAYRGLHGQALAAVIAGHHAGLADGIALDERLAGDLSPYPDWQAYSGPLPEAAALAPTRPFRRSPETGFSGAFLVRMLFSCLVDADSVETARLYDLHVSRGRFRTLAALRDRLDVHMDEIARSAAQTEINAIRAEVLAHVRGRATSAPGLFTLTVPTGGGKTLASLSFALDHAAQHGLRRIIYVIPYTSIIEQTADVFRKAFGSGEDVLEHHANFDWEAAARQLSAGRERDDEGGDPAARLHRAAENWDAPVVVTTAVQFFESLFAASRSRCRKLHNLAGAVIVLDEAQTLPLPLLRPCLAAIDELARNYGATVVLCTATQPAVRRMDGFEGGLEIDASRELAPDPARLYARLKRVAVSYRPEPVPDAEIVARFETRPQMLCIVNSRRHARQLFQAIASLDGAVHLTTLMCPRHRRAVLTSLRERLRRGEPVRLVATSLIEAGVDIDFPEVWRAATGLDAVAQAAGRCNREGGPIPGRVVVFEPAEAEPPKSIAPLWQAARPILRQTDDPLSLDAVRTYFRTLYWQKGRDSFDAARLAKRPWPILPAIAARHDTWKFPFDSIARAFRLIDEAMETVVVPWQAHEGDEDAAVLLARIAAMDVPLVADLRRLQLYTVAIPRTARDEWLARGVLLPVSRRLGDAVLRFADLSLYDPRTGIRLDDPTARSAEWNVM